MKTACEQALRYRLMNAGDDAAVVVAAATEASYNELRACIELSQAYVVVSNDGLRETAAVSHAYMSIRQVGFISFA